MADSATLLNGSAPATLPSLEKIAPGITCEWLQDRAIVAYTVRSVARVSIDAWLQHMKQHMLAWPPGRPHLVMQDLSEDSVGPTPYVRERTQEIARWRPELNTHVALILARTFQGRMIQFIVQAQRDPVARIFFSPPEGLAWLQTYLTTARR